MTFPYANPRTPLPIFCVKPLLRHRCRCFADEDLPRFCRGMAKVVQFWNGGLGPRAFWPSIVFEFCLQGRSWRLERNLPPLQKASRPKSGFTKFRVMLAHVDCACGVHVGFTASEFGVFSPGPCSGPEGGGSSNENTKIPARSPKLGCGSEI